MVIVPMPFESNAGVAHFGAEERPSMRNRLLVGEVCCGRTDYRRPAFQREAIFLCNER